MTFMLVLDLEGQSSFDWPKIRRCLEGVSGVHNWRETDESLFFEFAFNADSTDVELPTDRRHLTIWGMGDASLKIAVEIQQRYGEEILAVDHDCSFVIPLSTVTSLADFRLKTEQGFGRERLSGR